MPFLPERVGSFWSRSAQVDVVALNWRTKHILMGECKWGSRPVNEAVIKALVDKAQEVVPGKGSWHCHYVFFARQGFTKGAQALANKHEALLITLSDIEADMQRRLQTQSHS